MVLTRRPRRHARGRPRGDRLHARRDSLARRELQFVQVPGPTPERVVPVGPVVAIAEFANFKVRLASGEARRRFLLKQSLPATVRLASAKARTVNNAAITGYFTE
jgi:hypothetical protein